MAWDICYIKLQIFFMENQIFQALVYPPKESFGCSLITYLLSKDFPPPLQTTQLIWIIMRMMRIVRMGMIMPFCEFLFIFFWSQKRSLRISLRGFLCFYYRTIFKLPVILKIFEHPTTVGISEILKGILGVFRITENYKI